MAISKGYASRTLIYCQWKRKMVWHIRTSFKSFEMPRKIQ